jgi:formylglycine-generating enzyme required for sulfatase activity
MYSTWTNAAGSKETLPIDCVNWYEAYAFCIWDGGFLPSEAEWEYAAAGGKQQREYPWGSTDPGTNSQYAIYGCYYPNGSATPVGDAGVVCSGLSSIAPVGTAALGAGLWGQLDLAGNLWEWNLDWYATYVDPCADCACLTLANGCTAFYGNSRVSRGGVFDDAIFFPPDRTGGIPAARYGGTGFRCARTP